MKKQYGERLIDIIRMNEDHSLRRKILAKYRKTHWSEIKCIKCDSYGKEDNIIEVHHLRFKQQYPQLKSKSRNIVPICHRCHSLFHKLCNPNADTVIQFERFLGRPINQHLVENMTLDPMLGMKNNGGDRSSGNSMNH